MAIVDPMAPQSIHVARDTSVSNERLNEERLEHARTVKERETVGPRRVITVTEPDGSSKTYRTRDKIWRGPGCIRSGADWEALKRSKDIICLTSSQYAINNDLPEARYIIGEKALTTSNGIKGPREIVTPLDFARPPVPESREFSQGRWLEVGELYAGSDGTEVFDECLADGRIKDRRSLLDRAKSAAKKALSPKTSSKAAQ